MTTTTTATLRVLSQSLRLDRVEALASRVDRALRVDAALRRDELARRDRAVRTDHALMTLKRFQLASV